MCRCATGTTLSSRAKNLHVRTARAGSSSSGDCDVVTDVELTVGLSVPERKFVPGRAAGLPVGSCRRPPRPTCSVWVHHADPPLASDTVAISATGFLRPEVLLILQFLLYLITDMSSPSCALELVKADLTVQHDLSGTMRSWCTADVSLCDVYRQTQCKPLGCSLVALGLKHRAREPLSGLCQPQALQELSALQPSAEISRNLGVRLPKVACLFIGSGRLTLSHRKLATEYSSRAWTRGYHMQRCQQLAVLLAEFCCCGVHFENFRRWCKQLLRFRGAAAAHVYARVTHMHSCRKACHTSLTASIVWASNLQ